MNNFTLGNKSDMTCPMGLLCRPDSRLEEERTSGEYIFLSHNCEKNYKYNYYKKSAEIYMICQTIRIRIRNA